jgi:hypothetical protein
MKQVMYSTHPKGQLDLFDWSVLPFLRALLNINHQSFTNEKRSFGRFGLGRYGRYCL